MEKKRTQKGKKAAPCADSDGLHEKKSAEDRNISVFFFLSFFLSILVCVFHPPSLSGLFPLSQKLQSRPVDRRTRLRKRNLPRLCPLPASVDVLHLIPTTEIAPVRPQMGEAQNAIRGDRRGTTGCLRKPSAEPEFGRSPAVRSLHGAHSGGAEPDASTAAQQGSLTGRRTRGCGRRRQRSYK